MAEALPFPHPQQTVQTPRKPRGSAGLNLGSCPSRVHALIIPCLNSTPLCFHMPFPLSSLLLDTGMVHTITSVAFLQNPWCLRGPLSTVSLPPFPLVGSSFQAHSMALSGFCLSPRLERKCWLWVALSEQQHTARARQTISKGALAILLPTASCSSPPARGPP